MISRNGSIVELFGLNDGQLVVGKTGDEPQVVTMSGDVSINNSGSATVLEVGGATAANVATATALANAATDANTAGAIVRRDASGNFSAGAITATSYTGSGAGLTNIPNGALTNSSITLGTTNITLGGTATTLAGLTSVTSTSFTGNLTGDVTGTATNATTAVNFSGTLAGDVTGTQGSTVVSTVGGATAANVATATALANAATDANTAGAIVRRDASGNFSAGTITANLNGTATNATSATNAANAASADKLTTARSIYGNNFDGTANLTQVISSAYGGTGNGFTKFTGPTTSEKTFTLPDASAVIMTSSAALTQGSIPFANASGALTQDNANLFWDDANNRLGIGTNTPTAPLDVLGDVAVSASGSTTGSPRSIGITNWGAGNAARILFGDPWNALQNGYGQRMQLVGYWGIDVAGHRESATALGYVPGTNSDASLNVIGTQADDPVLTVTSAAGQTGNMQEWRNSGGSALAYVNSSGVFVSNVATGTAPFVVTSTTPVANLNIGGNAANVTGTVAIANGGTGQTTRQAALNALAGATTSGRYLRGDGSNISLSQLQAADLNGVVSIANGGTNNGSLAVTNGGVIYTDGSKLMNTGAGTAGNVLTSHGAGVPTWENLSTGFTGNSRQTVPAAVTRYAPINGTINPNNTDTQAFTRHMVWRSGTIKNLRVITNANPGAVNNTLTVMVNGVATALSVTLNNTTTGSDLTNQITINAGDEIGVRIQTPAGATAVYWSWTIEFTN